MGLHRPQTEKQLGGDLGVRPAVDDQPSVVQLPPAEPGDARRRGLGGDDQIDALPRLASLGPHPAEDDAGVRAHEAVRLTPPASWCASSAARTASSTSPAMRAAIARLRRFRAVAWRCR